MLEAQGGTTSDEVEAVRLVMQYMSSQLSTSIQSLGEKIEQIDLGIIVTISAAVDHKV